jgi:hypothetical protein
MLVRAAICSLGENHGGLVCPRRAALFKLLTLENCGDSGSSDLPSDLFSDLLSDRGFRRFGFSDPRLSNDAGTFPARKRRSLASAAPYTNFSIHRRAYQEQGELIPGQKTGDSQNGKATSSKVAFLSMASHWPPNHARREIPAGFKLDPAPDGSRRTLLCRPESIALLAHFKSRRPSACPT